MNRIRIAKRWCFLLSVGLLASCLLSVPGCGGRTRWINVGGQPRLVIIQRVVEVVTLDSPCLAEVAGAFAGYFRLDGWDYLLIEVPVRNRGELPLERVDVSVRIFDAYQKVVDQRLLFSTRTTRPGNLTQVRSYRRTHAGVVVRVEVQVVQLAYSDGRICELSAGPGGSSPVPPLPSGGGVGPEPASDGTLRSAQQLLNQLGYECGPADGVLGRKTRLCIEDFQRENALSVTGTLDPPTRQLLFEKGPGLVRPPTEKGRSPAPGAKEPSTEQEEEELW